MNHRFLEAHRAGFLEAHRARSAWASVPVRRMHGTTRTVAGAPRQRAACRARQIGWSALVPLLLYGVCGLTSEVAPRPDARSPALVSSSPRAGEIPDAATGKPGASSAEMIEGAPGDASAAPGGDAQVPRDRRIRVVLYSVDQIYRLRGHVGYQIDIQFETGEIFVGLGAGDIEGLSFSAQDNHLFLKPRATKVATNVTVLTNRRQYQFDYAASARRTDPEGHDVIYALRFLYPHATPGSESPQDAAARSARIAARLERSAAQRPRNFDYWYCGDAAIKPIAASDDGVQTRLSFAARSELPAIFVRNDDGSESLLNFSADAGTLIVHRVARQLIVRRGKLAGCIVNAGYQGGGERLESGTIARDVLRVTRGASR